MIVEKKISIFIVLAALTLSPMARAQQNYSTTGRHFKRGVAAVMFSTIGGAVLGLSTLSFYGKPQEHTDNITAGALVGLIAGIGYVAYDSSRNSTSPSGQYDFSSMNEPDLVLRRGAQLAKNRSVPVLNYQIEF